MMNVMIIVDVQNDFLPGGALPVDNGDMIIPVINTIQPAFDLVVATQDWHPSDHQSFSSMHPGKKNFDMISLHGLEQTLWPDHCVQGTPGADFSDRLHMNRVEAIFRKGTNPEIDSYSGFFDNGRKKSTGLADYLRGKKIQQVYVSGLAAEICVFFTAMDSLNEGFETWLIEDATMALQQENFQRAKAEFQQKGGKLIQSKEIAKISTTF